MHQGWHILLQHAIEIEEEDHLQHNHGRGSRTTICSALDVSRAKAARKPQETVGFVLERAMLHMIDNYLIIGSKVRRQDVIIASDI